MSEEEIRFLWLALAKVMNALEEAGETIDIYEPSRIEGRSDTIRWDHESDTWRRTGYGC